MAAGQQKKRLNGASVVSCNFQEQHRGKKEKSSECSHNALNMRSHISLEWDDTQKRVMAKREQIGMSWRDMSAFISSVTRCQMGLADVFPVPIEIFELKNLNMVLTYEVWKTCLSDSERRVLLRFLPKVTNVDRVVHALLMGENLHFGNQFFIWGTALCSGNLHPDAVLLKDRCFKATKKAYYPELQKYHNDILENLQKWKDKWASCKDPEKDIVEKLWSCPQKKVGKSIMSHVNESGEHRPEDNLTATADSYSWVVDEKVCIGDKKGILGKRGAEPQDRNGSRKRQDGSLLVASGKVKGVSICRKHETPLKLQIRSGSSAKYMSYIKISKKQHQLIKMIKQCGDGIQSKSLNRVLGDIKCFPIQPYEIFEEEEKKKLHEHWLQLVHKDLPRAVANCKERQIKKQQFWKSLVCEFVEKGKVVAGEDEERKTVKTSAEEQGRETETKVGPIFQDSEDCEDDPIPQSISHHLQGVPSLNSDPKVGPIVRDSEDCNQDILKQKDAASSVLEFIEKEEDIVKSDTSEKEIWDAVTMSNSYHPPASMGHGYTSAGDLSLERPQHVEEQSNRLIDLENDVLEQEDDKSLLCRPSDECESALHTDNWAPIFSYANQDHIELLPPFLKEQAILQSYSHEHINGLKHGLEFLTTNDCPPENRQFPMQFQEQQQEQLFEQRQLREEELYMRQVIPKNMLSNGRYRSQELFPIVDVQDWPAEPVRKAAFQSRADAGLLGQNWFSGEQQVHNGWSSVEVSGATEQCLGEGTDTDGSLFSMLPQCNNLRSQSQYCSISSDHCLLERNFVSGTVSGNGNVLSYSPHPLSYLSMCEATATRSMCEATATTTTLKASETLWMNLPRVNLPQNSKANLHDSVGKPLPWRQ